MTLYGDIILSVGDIGIKPGKSGTSDTNIRKPRNKQFMADCVKSSV